MKYFIVLLLCGMASNVQADQKVVTTWNYNESKDEMTNEKSAYISSPSVSPTKKMNFPYGDIRAWIGVGCNKDSEWSYIGFTKQPIISDTNITKGHSNFFIRVKWDEKIGKMWFSQKWGSKFIRFRDDEASILNMEKSKSVLVEFNWHGEQRVYFRFPLIGSGATLQKMRKFCSG